MTTIKRLSELPPGRWRMSTEPPKTDRPVIKFESGTVCGGKPWILYYVEATQ